MVPQITFKTFSHPLWCGVHTFNPNSSTLEADKWIFFETKASLVYMVPGQLGLQGNTVPPILPLRAEEIKVLAS